MAQRMLTTLRPEDKTIYPTPGSHSLKRKLEAILSQDPDEKFTCSKRASISGSSLQENGCKPILSPPPIDKDETSSTNAYSQNVTQSYLSLSGASMSGQKTAFVDRTAPFNFAYQPGQYISPTELNFSNPYKFLPPISQPIISQDSGTYSPLTWGTISMPTPLPPLQTMINPEMTKVCTESSGIHEPEPLQNHSSKADHVQALELQQDTIGSSESDELNGFSNAACKKCKGKDELLDVQQNMILHLQHMVAVSRMALPMQNSYEMNYMRLSVRQGKIPRALAEKHQMFEILVLAEYQSGVFLSNTFKYDLEVNHSDRGTLMAKKMLHAFYTEYDLAYAGNLLGRCGSPGVDNAVLRAIECFVASRAKRCYERPSIRATLSTEITIAKRARDSKGLKLFHRDRLLENPNNVPPTVNMKNVVADIKEVMRKTAAEKEQQ